MTITTLARMYKPPRQVPVCHQHPSAAVVRYGQYWKCVKCGAVLKVGQR